MLSNPKQSNSPPGMLTSPCPRQACLGKAKNVTTRTPRLMLESVCNSVCCYLVQAYCAELLPCFPTLLCKHHLAAPSLRALGLCQVAHILQGCILQQGVLQCPLHSSLPLHHDSVLCKKNTLLHDISVLMTWQPTAGHTPQQANTCRNPALRSYSVKRYNTA